MAADYRNFRLRKLNQPEYRHMWLLLFWPAFICKYILIENLNPAAEYHVVECLLDRIIPFNEFFLIPYGMWYVMIAGMHLYTLLYDVEAFKRYSKFLIVSMSISTLIFLVYPSCQNLRPEVFPRDNVLTDIVALIYGLDTSTNVFPSEHAIGALAVLAAAANTRSLRTPGRLCLIGIAAALVCVSTVFLKQHSALDVLAALPVCAAAYCICYPKKEKREK